MEMIGNSQLQYNFTFVISFKVEVANFVKNKQTATVFSSKSSTKMPTLCIMDNVLTTCDGKVVITQLR